MISIITYVTTFKTNPPPLFKKKKIKLNVYIDKEWEIERKNKDREESQRVRETVHLLLQTVGYNHWFYLVIMVC